MKMFVRVEKSHHVTETLAEFPVKGIQVREAHVALEHATKAVSQALLEADRANDAARDSEARVRDATLEAREECKRGRATLIAKGAHLAPNVVVGHSTPAILERAAFLIGRADAIGGVKLSDLVAARAELRSAVAKREAALAAKHVVATASKPLRDAWDDKFHALRAAIVAQLRHEGHSKADLRQLLLRYFPRKVVRSASATVAQPAVSPTETSTGSAPAA
jgi:hypothetical protein